MAEPALAPETVDVGLRTEPNPELLIQLRPSLLLLSEGFGPSPKRLSTIAPCMTFPFTDAQGKPLTVARHSLMQLAERIGKVSEARTHLSHFDMFLASWSRRLGAKLRKPLLLMSVLDNRHALVFGRGSLFVEVMEIAGIENAWQGETNFWGSAVVGLEQLAGLQDVEVICFDHDNHFVMQQMMASPLWQALPFVRKGNFHQAPAVWFFGATLSVMRFCQIVEQALEG
ncbi:MAG: Iron(3+)-hydroxamate-binding protein FhuD [Candidatus Erwinia impunctatus]